jgi:hypothetical protein
VGDAAAADVTGWGFDWLNVRATEERPAWGYARLLAHRLGQVKSALDIDNGGGEVFAEVSTFPPRMVATESWPANAQHASELLGSRGVHVIETVKGRPRRLIRASDVPPPGAARLGTDTPCPRSGWARSNGSVRSDRP